MTTMKINIGIAKADEDLAIETEIVTLAANHYPDDLQQKGTEKLTDSRPLRRPTPWSRP